MNNDTSHIILPTADFFVDKDAFPEKLPLDVLSKFFETLGAEPYFATSDGDDVIMLRGLCHHSNSGSHSVICGSSGFCHCFSACGDSTPWWNYAARAWRCNQEEAKTRIKEWLNNNNIDIKAEGLEYHKVEPYEPKHIEPLPKIENVNKWYSKFDQSVSTMVNLTWHKNDKISVGTLLKYGVAYYPEHKTIILPHHNINGEIIGMYERHFQPLQKEIRKALPEVEKGQLLRLPRAKYMPLYDPELEKTLSFKNSRNLYGLFLAKDAIKKSGKAIIFEGGKSVMLANQAGYKYTVASHTFGAHENHISMLIECGAKEIILAFDKQYQCEDEDNNEWQLYEKKTRKLAERVKDYVKISRLRDLDGELEYKDAPIDKGIEVFEHILSNRELLN